VGAAESDVTGGLFLLAVVSIFFPVFSLLAAIWLFLSAEATLGVFFLLWWVIWDENVDERRNS
jgi:hypothetical protein